MRPFSGLAHRIGEEHRRPSGFVVRETTFDREPMFDSALPRSSYAFVSAVWLWGAACTPHAPPGEINPVPTGTAAYAEVPLLRDGGYALVPVSIGGTDSLWFVLDSAAGGSVISPATRDLLGLGEDAGTEATITGASGDASFQALEIDSMSIGGFTRTKVGVVVIDLTRFQKPESQRTYAGILGNDFLRRFDFALDLPHQSLRLYPRDADGQSRLAGLDTLACVPNLADDEGWVVMDVSVEGTPVRAIVDTGAGRSVFNWVAAKAAGVTPESPGITRSDRSTQGLGAQRAETHHYQFERVEAGQTRFRPVESRIADISVFRALGLSERPAVIFGTNYLEDRVLTVSYSTKQICFSDPIADRGG